MATSRTRCVTCEKEKVTSKCSGCFQDFCYTHLGQHRQEVSQQLDEIEVHRDRLQQTLDQQTTNSQKHSLIQKIDRWESESIEIIKQKADEARQSLARYIHGHITRIEQKLSELTNQLKHSREEDDIMETDLHKWKTNLQTMSDELNNPSHIKIQLSSIPLINDIRLELSTLIFIPAINVNAKWTQIGITVAGGNGRGNGLNQLYNPWSVYVDDDQTIYVADCSNHRIVEWKKGATIGQMVAGGKRTGNRNDQFNGPANVIVDRKNESLIICDAGNCRVMRWPLENGKNGEIIISNIVCCGLAMDNDGYLYVSHYQKHEVRRWKMGEKDGVLVAGGNGGGNSLDQLNQPYYIFVDPDQSVYVSDYGNHRVMKWVKDAREGIIVAGGQGPGNALNQLSNPRGIVVDQFDTVYVTDQKNHRIMRWLKGATEGSVVIGGNGQGAQANQLNNPLGLSIDRQNNLYVIDYNNDRTQKFNLASSFAS